MTIRRYSFQDNAANHTVLDDGGSVQNGTAGVNTSTISKLAGPGLLLPRVLGGITSIAVPQFTFWQADTPASFSCWLNMQEPGNSAQAFLFGNSGGACGMGIQSNDDGLCTLFGEDDSSDGVFGPDNIVFDVSFTLRHIAIVLNPVGGVALYQDTVLLIDTGDESIMPGGNITVNALCDSGVDQGNQGLDGDLADMTFALLTQWTQADVNASYARGKALPISGLVDVLGMSLGTGLSL